MAETQGSLATDLIGTWWLIDRIDTAADGSLRSEPNLGSDPLAMVTYTSERFAAQFMRRDRQIFAAGKAAEATPSKADVVKAEAVKAKNNTSAVDGYDAYFGSYRILEEGVVLHKLDAALTRANIGIEVERTMSVRGDQLTITLETTAKDGEPVTRTLRWTRLR